MQKSLSASALCFLLVFFSKQCPEMSFQLNDGVGYELHVLLLAHESEYNENCYDLQTTIR